MKTAQVYSTLKYIHISPKKVAPVLDLVRGKSTSEALRVLKFDHTKGAALASKVLKTAIADAVNSHKLDGKALYVAETWVDGGPVLKRGRASGRGRYSPLLKRTSHIVMGLSDRKAK